MKCEWKVPGPRPTGRGDCPPVEVSVLGRVTLATVAAALAFALPAVALAEASSAAAPGAPAPSAAAPAMVVEQEPLLAAAAAAEITAMAVQLAGQESEVGPARGIVKAAELETKRVRKLLARAVERARDADDKARAAEIGRANVDVSRLERELRAAATAADSPAFEVALDGARRRAEALRMSVSALVGGPRHRVLGVSVWRLAAETPPRPELMTALARGLLAAVTAAEPKVSADLQRRCRLAVERVAATVPPPDAAAWAELGSVARELALNP